MVCGKRVKSCHHTVHALCTASGWLLWLTSAGLFCFLTLCKNTEFLSHQRCLIATDGHALLVVRGGLVVGVGDGVRGDAVGVVRLRPGVDGVDVAEHGHGEESEHDYCKLNQNQNEDAQAED